MTMRPVEPVSRSIPASLAGAAWLSLTTLLALLALYLVGIEQGAVSLFGSNHSCPRIHARCKASAELPVPLSNSRHPGASRRRDHYPSNCVRGGT